jgi:hypothetical protein
MINVTHEQDFENPEPAKKRGRGRLKGCPPGPGRKKNAIPHGHLPAVWMPKAHIDAFMQEPDWPQIIRDFVKSRNPHILRHEKAT